MSTLNCSVRNCDHNSNGMCTAAAVNIQTVDSNIEVAPICATFVDEDGEIGLRSNVANNYMVGMMNGFSSSAFEMTMSPFINCNETDCNYNFSGQCGLNGINIQKPANSGHSAICDTYVHKAFSKNN